MGCERLMGLEVVRPLMIMPAAARTAVVPMMTKSVSCAPQEMIKGWTYTQSLL